MRNRPLVTPQRKTLLSARAHGLRSSMTPSEQALWELIKANRLGVAFKRQVVIGQYIADFVAPARRVVVEVDGGYHRIRATADARRDRVLGRLGYHVVRVDADLVREAPLEAVARIRQALAQAR